MDSNFPPASEVDLVVGHSLGGWKADKVYGGTGPRVISLNSPFPASNKDTESVRNALDPVGLLSPALDIRNSSFVSLRHGHDKNFAYKQVSDTVE